MTGGMDGGTGGDSERSRWRGQCRSTVIARVLIGLGVLVAVALPALLATSTDAFTSGPAAAVGAVTAAAVPAVLLIWAGATFSVVRVTVDDDAVRVACGPWGFPRWTRPRAELEAVEATTLSAARWGGWGWRWSGQGTAVVLRSGPALRMVPREGRPFHVTVDDPAAAVRALRPTGT